MYLAALVSALATMVVAEATIIVYTQDVPHTIVEEFRDMPADFGVDIPLEGIRGYLVIGQPADGCSNMTAPPIDDNFTGRWMALIAKTGCSYEMKVRNAQLAGFDAAIVHNVNSTELEIMTAEDADGIVIAAVFVSDIAGSILAKDYTYTEGFYIMVNSELPFNINTHLLLPFAIVVVACLLVILIFMIVKCIKDRRRARRHRLPTCSLNKIPTYKFSKGDPYETCAICLDDYQEGERLRVLPCAHAYHTICIDPWLTQNKRVCPVCKRRVFGAGERRRVLSSDDGSSNEDSSDTEPLLAAPPVTQGGTFDEQRENPFARATRFMVRLRARANGEQVAASPPNDEHMRAAAAAAADEENGNTDDRAPLLAAPAVRAVSERRSRRARRTRSARAPHSINTTGRGEIGVAALPATPAPDTPRHVDL